MSFNNLSNTVSSIDYSKLAGPYFSIYVNGSKNPLPQWLSKQIKSIEITEVDAHATTTDSLDMAIITIIDNYENVTETSNDLFNSGTITGKPGNILDLVLTSDSQIRVLSKKELADRKKVYSKGKDKTVKQLTSSILSSVTILSYENSHQNLILASSITDPQTGVVPNLLNSVVYIGDTPEESVKGTIIAQNGLTISVSGIESLIDHENEIVDITIEVTKLEQIPAPAPKLPKIPKYLFQEGNTLDIEWGYKTDTPLSRRMRFTIQYVEYDAPEASSPEAKIYCMPKIVSDLGKLHPVTGHTFANPTTTSSGNTSNNDVYAGDIIKKIADACGYKAVISKNTGRIDASDLKPTEFTKTITPNDSIYGYMNKIAKDIGFHLFVGHDYKSKKETIFFLSDEDFSKKALFNFIWKGQNTLLTSYKINSDFSKINSGATVTATPSGPVVNTQDQASLTIGLFDPEDKQKTQISTQLSETVDQGIKSIFKNGVTGTSVSTPVDQTNANKTMLDQHLQRNESSVILTGTTIGYPFLSPCVAQFTNIGERYDGRYSIMNVKHVIDISGYKIQFTAKTNVIGQGSVDQNKQPGDKKLPVDDNLTIKILQGTDQTSTSPITNTEDLAKNFNSVLEAPGKVVHTSSTGSNSEANQ